MDQKTKIEIELRNTYLELNFSHIEIKCLTVANEILPQNIVITATK